MKNIKDMSLFAPEFEKLIRTHNFINMSIYEKETEMVIYLKKQDETRKSVVESDSNKLECNKPS